MREEFYKVDDLPDKHLEQMNKTEPHALMGDHDTEGEKLGVILGVWKPVYPSEVRHEILRTFCFLIQTSTYQVCDYPLAVMDASTFYERNQIVYNLHLNLIFAVWNSLSSVISYNPEQKWYYYSNQNTKEVLVFHQYSKIKLLTDK